VEIARVIERCLSFSPELRPHGEGSARRPGGELTGTGTERKRATGSTRVRSLAVRIADDHHAGAAVST
jgi:hypothetical protein